VLLTGNGKVSQVNKGFEEMFGYTLDELKDKSINDFIVPEELAHEGIDLHNVVASNHVILRETVRLHRSGRELNVLLYGMPVKFDSQTIGIYGVYIDITTRKRIEEELKIRNAELDNFVYKVSHDLRAPLRAVDGYARMLEEDYAGKFDAEGGRLLRAVRANAHRMGQLIDDLLAFSRLGRAAIRSESVEMTPLVEQVIGELHPDTDGRTMDERSRTCWNHH